MADEAREGIITGFGTVTIDIEAPGNYRIETLDACGLGEVTPEMVYAGVEAYCGFDERFESLQEMIGRVYCAMALMATGNARAREGRRRMPRRPAGCRIST